MKQAAASLWYDRLRPMAWRVSARLLRFVPISSRLGGVPKGVIWNAAEWIGRTEARKPWAERGSAHWQVKVRDSELIPGRQPKTIEESVHPVFALHRFYRFPELTVSCIHRGRVATTEGTVISPDDRVFEQFTHQWGGSIWNNAVFTRPGLVRPEYKEGPWATLVVPASSVNVGHWLMDGVLRLAVLEAAGLAKETRLILPNLQPKFTEPIEALGYGPDRYDGLQGGHWEVEHLLVPSYVSPPGYMRPWACRWLRNRLGVDARPVGKRRLWISRGRARWRRVVNEEELLPILKKAGFEPVELERLSFREQVKTLSQAGVVAGPHGAGMTDLLFAPHGIRVLEFFSPGFVNPVFYSMANALEQDYGYAVGETLEEDRHPGGSKDLDHFRISPDRLRDALRMMKLAS
jgi:hypothetical protein